MPYLILVCLARSSAEFTGEDILEAVRKAGGIRRKSTSGRWWGWQEQVEPTSKVCRVGGDHDEGEEPPQGGDHPGREGTGNENSTLTSFLLHIWNKLKKTRKL